MRFAPMSARTHEVQVWPALARVPAVVDLPQEGAMMTIEVGHNLAILLGFYGIMGFVILLGWPRGKR